jgi:acyl carrier protein
MNREQILHLVINTVVSLVDTFPDSDKFLVKEDTILFGDKSCIDSLSLVSVIVDLEVLLSDEFGIDMTLTDDRAMTREISPFDNVANLVDYIFEIICEKQNS